MSLRGWVGRQKFRSPVWLAAAAAVVAFYGVGIISFNSYAPTLRSPVFRATVVKLQKSNDRRCGRVQDPELIVTFRVVDGHTSDPVFHDQMCLFDVRVGDTVRVVRRPGGHVMVNPLTLGAVIARSLGSAAAAWAFVFLGTLLTPRKDKVEGA